MTDNGPCYRAHRFNRALAAQGVRQVYTQPYRPQTGVNNVLVTYN